MRDVYLCHVEDFSYGPVSLDSVLEHSAPCNVKETARSRSTFELHPMKWKVMLFLSLLLVPVIIVECTFCQDLIIDTGKI